MGDNNIFIGVWPGEKFPLPWWSVPPSFCAHLPSRSPHPLAGLTSLTWKNSLSPKFHVLLWNRQMGKIFLLKLLSNQCRHQKVVEAAGFQLFNIDISNSNFQGKPGKEPGFLFLTTHLKSPLCVVMDMSRNTMIEQDFVERLNHRIVIFESKDDFQIKS